MMRRPVRHRLPQPSPVRLRPSIDASVTGLVFCSLMMFMGLAAMNTQANLLFGVFGLMIGILLVSFATSRLVLRKLVVTRILPDHGIVGRPLAITYQLHNAKRFWPSFSVTMAELDGASGFRRQPQAYMLHAAAGMTAIVPTEVVPRMRGRHTFDRYQVSTSFPFGFIKRAMLRRQHDTLVVFPALAQVDRQVLRLCRSAESSGPTMRPRRGGTDEFFGVKEFREGENPRHIYWRRSARTGQLVVREMTQVAPPRLLVLVDTHVPDADAAEAIERVIAMAASVASAALEAGVPVGLFCWTGRPTGIRASRGKRHRLELLSTLAQLPRNRAYPRERLVGDANEYRDAGSTVMLFTRAPTRGGEGLVVLGPSAPEADWFRFDEGLDFARAAPPATAAGDGPED